ncbi:MAG: HD domain-containing protein [Chloroflexota bacterium]
MFDPETFRKYYSPEDVIHGFDHVWRVVKLARRLAWLEGADEQIVEAAAWLHDAQDLDGETQKHSRLQHQDESAAIAGAVLAGWGWPMTRISAVQHCIRAHRFRSSMEMPQTLEAKTLFDADKLDAIGAVGAARAIGYAVQRGEPFYARPSPSFLQEGVLEEGEHHSAYHEFVFKLGKLKDRLYTASGRQLAEERHAFMVDFFQRLQAECEVEG